VPETLKPEAYERTLKARASTWRATFFPGTNTSLGQIVNARTLGPRFPLLSHPMAEIRDLGQKLRNAATGPAWNVNAQSGAALVNKLSSIDMDDHSALAAEAAIFSRAKSGPRLRCEIRPAQQLSASNAGELTQVAAEILANERIAKAPCRPGRAYGVA